MLLASTIWEREETDLTFIRHFTRLETDAFTLYMTICLDMVGKAALSTQDILHMQCNTAIDIPREDMHIQIASQLQISYKHQNIFEVNLLSAILVQAKTACQAGPNRVE